MWPFQNGRQLTSACIRITCMPVDKDICQISNCYNTATKTQSSNPVQKGLVPVTCIRWKGNPGLGNFILIHFYLLGWTTDQREALLDNSDGTLLGDQICQILIGYDGHLLLVSAPQLSKTVTIMSTTLRRTQGLRSLSQCHSAFWWFAAMASTIPTHIDARHDNYSAAATAIFFLANRHKCK